MALREPHELGEICGLLWQHREAPLGARPDDSDDVRRGERMHARVARPLVPAPSGRSSCAHRSQMIGLHTDAEYGHQPGELNFLLGLTAVHGSNGLYVESAPGRSYYSFRGPAPGWRFVMLNTYEVTLKFGSDSRR